MLQYEGDVDVFPSLYQIISRFAVWLVYNATMTLPSLCSGLCCWCFAGECSDGDSVYISGAGGARGEGAGAGAKGGDARWKRSGL